MTAQRKNEKFMKKALRSKKKTRKKSKKPKPNMSGHSSMSRSAQVDKKTLALPLAQASASTTLMSTPKRKTPPSPDNVPKLFSIETPKRRMKHATPSIFKSFDRICTVCKKIITTKDHLLLECTGIPETPSSRPISRHAANRRSLTRLKRALKMSTKIDFG